MARGGKKGNGGGYTPAVFGQRLRKRIGAARKRGERHREERRDGVGGAKKREKKEGGQMTMASRKINVFSQIWESVGSRGGADSSNGS